LADFEHALLYALISSRVSKIRRPMVNALFRLLQKKFATVVHQCESDGGHDFQNASQQVNSGFSAPPSWLGSVYLTEGGADVLSLQEGIDDGSAECHYSSSG
jgi:hypothetical protein